MNSEEFTAELWNTFTRSREGFRAFAATVDLIGMKAQMLARHQARARLDGLQQGFGEALLLFPGTATTASALPAIRYSWSVKSTRMRARHRCGRHFAVTSMLWPVFSTTWTGRWAIPVCA
jgi:hypothetical protein